MAASIVINRGPRSWKFTLEEARYVSQELSPLAGGGQKKPKEPVKRRKRRVTIQK
jgi:hypothetical protein